MHFNFGFTAVQVLWTLTFAAQLVLLVVLLGRERIRIYPWFTTVIVLGALRLLATRMLYGRLAPLPFNAILITLADLTAIAGLMVLVELTRRAFGGVQRRTWIVWTLALVAVGAGVLAVWGHWPAWKTLTADSSLAALLLMQLAAQKGDLLVGVLTVEVGLLIALFGRRFKAGWRSHTQQIAIGLSTFAMTQMAVQGVWQIVVLTVHPHTQQEYQRVLGLRDKLLNASNAVFLAVLIWWIVCLWIEEPGTAAEATPGEIQAADAPAEEQVEEQQ
jgi:hypothetical protein